jgi:hypothetical protein
MKGKDMKKLLMMTTALTLIAPIAFANSNAGSKLYICTTAQDSDLTKTAYEALTWVEVVGVGSFGEVGTQTNILTYDTWDTDVIQKAKGMSNAGDPEVEVARNPSDTGQTALRTAADTNNNYAFKITRNDTPSGGTSPTTIYIRGLVAGPRRPQGRNEDFDLEIFTLGLQQKEIVVDPV